jgi:hypothetical protein
VSKRTWHVSAVIVGNQYVGAFDAESGEEAIALASLDARTSLCHQCSHVVQDADVECMTAESGDDVVTNEETWQDRARAAGWTPPKKRARKGGAS